VLLPKDGGKVRPLAIPTIRDRVVQRAACAVLGPALDTLLEDSSYAYRKGLSRAAAAVAIERAHDEGFRWVLDADIESFFDCVDHARLFAKLEALYPGEPLVPLLERWVAAPVEFQGRVIERRRGLPQGAVVSPLLANLYLDELDEELLAQGFRLVRYADDFVVLCRDLDAARAAQEATRAGLAKLGLELKEEKTGIRSFDAGFTYLGYLFCRSLVLERTKHSDAGAESLAPDGVPPASWLAEVPFENVREALTHRRVQPRRKREGPAPRPLAAVAPVLRPLYITDPAAELVLRHEKLVVSSPTAGMREIGIRTISHLVLVGRVRATVPVLLALSRLGVPCFFARRTGSVYAELGPHAPNWPVWQAQAAKAGDPAARLEFARAVIQAKLHNTATIAVRHKLQGCGELADDLRNLERRCLEQSDADALRGLEGRGAACFFAALKTTLPGEWGFVGRRRSPPPDPINAMLSFAYTVLYNHISTALLATGLHPRIGLFHAERGAYHALACDLQEEFRHLAESHVIAIVHRRELSPDDFVVSADGRYPSLLSDGARREFLGGFERRLLTEFTPPGSEEKLSYLAFIDGQVQRLKVYVEGRAAAYEPLRIHA
jgi:CRISP-associated protein Cas1